MALLGISIVNLVRKYKNDGRINNNAHKCQLSGLKAGFLEWKASHKVAFINTFLPT